MLEGFRRLLESSGFTTYTSSYVQRTLTGGSVRVGVVVGVSRDHSGRVQVTALPGSVRLLVVYHAGDEASAEDVAERLEDLGGAVEVDGDRVVASFSGATPTLLSRVLSVLKR